MPIMIQFLLANIEGWDNLYLSALFYYVTVWVTTGQPQLCASQCFISWARPLFFFSCTAEEKIGSGQTPKLVLPCQLLGVEC